jgi:hypothetical protein
LQSDGALRHGRVVAKNDLAARVEATGIGCDSNFEVVGGEGECVAVEGEGRGADQEEDREKQESACSCLRLEGLLHLFPG